MINIPNIFRPGVTRKALKRKVPGQSNVTHTQATDAAGEYNTVDRRQGERRKEDKDVVLDTRKKNRRKGDDQPHIDINA
ncbi:hypothetical protein [Pseudoteredinibacter isoporae]|uniref:hypothetical protein n=1 Tax=Pseudoteredinibacter isoporae TaxID=570281 RepID=UPI003341E46E